MNNAIKKIALISDYFNLYLITLFIFFIKPQLFSYYQISEFKDQKLFNEIKMAFAKNWNKNLIDLSNQPLLI